MSNDPPTLDCEEEPLMASAQETHSKPNTNGRSANRNLGFQGGCVGEWGSWEVKNEPRVNLAVRDLKLKYVGDTLYDRPCKHQDDHLAVLGHILLA